ncbi:MAG TPA: OmpA family protein [Firmicutes bacterium]|jgi:chemotaxis protein MotB|nr:flagellar motor protein MotB [Bacillota bacterium]HHT42800.1 OmpA family protein [Bacillota bacterium]
MRRRRQEESESSGSWLTTYSDMMSLLLAFFVLLFSMSAVDEAKFASIIAAFQNYLGILDQGPTLLEQHGPIPFDYSDVSRRQLSDLYEQLSEMIEVEGLQGVELELQERGLIVRFAEQVFFDLGEAALKPEALEVLKTLAGTLKTLPNPLRVEGHTDNWPISTARFPSNWELSVHRATNVVRFLIEEEGFDPNKLSVAGYSEYRPIRPNDTAEDRAMNRRVDIVILSLDLWDFEPN